MKAILTRYTNVERSLTIKVRLLSATLVFMTAVGLYAAHRFSVANESALYWQYMYVSNGGGDGL